MCCVGPTVVCPFVSWYIFNLLVRPFFVNVFFFFLLFVWTRISHVPSLSPAYNATGGSLNIQVSIRARQCFQLFFFSFLFFSFLFTFSFLSPFIPVLCAMGCHFSLRRATASTTIEHRPAIIRIHNSNTSSFSSSSSSDDGNMYLPIET